MAVLFQIAVHFYCSGRVVTEPEVRKWRRRGISLAKEIRQKADELWARVIGTERELKILLKLAEECEQSAKAPIAGTVLARARGDLRLRAYLVRLTQETKRLFGNPLYGTVATIASVASQQNVTADMVRAAGK